MTRTEYEQKRAKCWEEFCKANPTHKDSAFARGIFAFIFDRAYALGREKETITQEEIEKAAKKYAAEVDKNIRDLYGNIPAAITFGECAAESFREGVKFALGRQEKDADSFEIGDKVRVKETKQIGTIIEPYSNDTGYRVYFDDGDGGEDTEYSADQLELYKKAIVETKDADTVIQGWVARDCDNDIFLYQNEPDRNEIVWNGYMMHSLPKDSFPDLTWDDEPQQVEIIIKRKKK